MRTWRKEEKKDTNLKKDKKERKWITNDKKGVNTIVTAGIKPVKGISLGRMTSIPPVESAKMY